MVRLILNTGSSVDSHYPELIVMMLHFGEFSCNLNRQLTSWSKNDGLNFACAKQFVFTEILDSWKTKGEGLARACEVSSDEILSVVDWVEAVLLNWK